MQNKSNSNIQAIDIIRVVAILAVVAIHTTTRSMEAVFLYLPKVPVSIFLNQISRFAVPIFFLISGFVLEISYKEGTGYLTYIKKRIGKIFLPYIFWSGIYYVFIYTQHGVSFPCALVGGNASYQLYFIPSLFVYYLIFPGLHRILVWLSKWWLFFPLMALQIWLLYLDYYRLAINMFDPLRIIILNLGCFIFGMVISEKMDLLKQIVERSKYLFLCIPVALGAYVVYEGQSRYLTSWNSNEFYSQWRPSIFLYSLTLFTAGFYILEKVTRRFRLVSEMSANSFLVFFIHIIVLENIWSAASIFIFKGNAESTVRQFWWDPLFFILTVLISFIIAAVIHKIPKIYKLTG